MNPEQSITFPPAKNVAPGSMVLVSMGSTDKQELYIASVFWLFLAFGAGYAFSRFYGRKA